MSFIALIGYDYAVIGTDTMVKFPYQEGDEEVRPMLFSSSTFHLPQFKSCFTATGHQLLGTSFYLFAMQRAVGRDIQSIVKLDLDDFMAFAEKQSGGFKLMGSIILMGINTATGRMEAYVLRVNLEGQEMKWIQPEKDAESGTMMIASPIIELARDEAVNRIRRTASNKEYVTEVVKIQREEDDLLPLDQRRGIGGEIIVTEMFINVDSENLYISSEVTHTWDDYDQQLHSLQIDEEYTDVNREILKGLVNPLPFLDSMGNRAN